MNDEVDREVGEGCFESCKPLIMVATRSGKASQSLPLMAPALKWGT